MLENRGDKMERNSIIVIQHNKPIMRKKKAAVLVPGGNFELGSYIDQ